MKKLSLTLFCCLLVAMTTWGQFTSAPAFPGAEGYGRYTTGGRGGTVYHVTTLEDYCDNTDYSSTQTKESEIVGSLRYAVKKSGARIIVFDVAGTIELKAPLKIQNDNITILGQTAPGDGICLKNYTLGIFANNVIIRYIRCRMGDEGKRYYSNGSALTNTAFEDDAMNAYQKTGSEKHNIIIDHCSISWCVDECGSFYGNENFTLQWCILSESLRNSVHDKGAHGYGGIWGGSDASFHHNLLAHHDSRMIRFDHDYVSTCKGPVDYVNNVVYNWGSNSTYGGESSNGTYKTFNMVNNYYKPGPATKSGVKTRLLNPTTKCDNCTSTSKTPTSTGSITPGHFYISGNYMYGSTAVTNDNTCDAAIDPDNTMTYSNWKSTCLSNSRFTSSAENHLNMHSAENAFNNVVSYAGASLKRDNVDTRIANETRNGTSTYTGSNGSTGGLIDTPSDVGGYPTLTGTKATDTDGDGIPDEWEDAHGLNKNDASDALTKTLDSRGFYTNLEVYANYLVQHITKAERAGATESFEEYYPLDDSDPVVDPVDPTPAEGDVEYTLASHGNTTDSANEGVSYTIPGTYIAGGGNVDHTIGETTDKGVKMRTGNALFSGTSTSLDGTKKFEIDVKDGYAITAMTFKAANNYANTSVLTGIYVDGDYTKNILASSITFGSDKTANGGSVSGFTAKQKIEFAVTTTKVGDVSGTQLNFLAAITYKVATPDPTSVIVSPANKTIEVGDELQLSAQVLPASADQSVTWSSENTSIATVDASGKVTAKATGTAKITVTAANGLKDYCLLTVVAKQSGGSGNVSFTSADFSSNAGSKTKEGVTLTLNVESHNSNSTIKCKSTSNTLTFSSNESITSIVVNCSSSNFTKVTATPNVGTISADNNTYKYTWSGNSKDIIITFSRAANQNSDQSVYASSIDVVTASAPTTQTLTKHISSSTWASFVPEKSVVVPENVNVYYVKSGSYNASDKTVQAVKIEAGTVIQGDGNTGYIVNAAEGDYQFEVSTDDAQTFSENILACGKNETIAEGSLVFGRIDGVSGFYALDDYAIKLPVGIVYLPAGVFGTNNAKAVTINFDEATSVDWFNSSTPQFNGTIFNINGQKVDANYKGIIIRNGRKYINK